VAFRREGRDAATGKNYHDVGLFVGVDGADSLIPQGGLLRFGGDERDAAVVPCSMRWAISSYPDRGRRAEGFSKVSIAAWPQE
jgi:hypothetical protein